MSYNWEATVNEDGETTSWHIQNEEQRIIVHVDTVYVLRVTSFQDEQEIKFQEQYASRADAMDKGEEVLVEAVKEFEDDPPS